MDMSVTAGVPGLRSYFRLVRELLGGQNEKRPQMVWIGHPAIVYSIQRWFWERTSSLVAINTRREYSECVRVIVSANSLTQYAQ